MAKAVLCPVCKGVGQVNGGSSDIPEWFSCHGCPGGRGWVEVADDGDGLIPLPHPPYPGTPFLYYSSPQYPGYFYPAGPWWGAVIGQPQGLNNLGGKDA